MNISEELIDLCSIAESKVIACALILEDGCFSNG